MVTCTHMFFHAGKLKSNDSPLNISLIYCYCWVDLNIRNTTKPVYNGHPSHRKKVAVV